MSYLGQRPAKATTTTITAFDQSNTAIDTSVVAYDQSNTAIAVSAVAYDQSNTAIATSAVAYDQSNTAITSSGVAYDQSNTAITTSAVAYDQSNTAIATSAVAYDQSNTAIATSLAPFNQANTARTQANTSYDQANVVFVQANTAYDQANVVFVQANTAYDQANTAYDQANTATTISITAYDQANTALPNTSGSTFSGNLAITGTILNSNGRPILQQSGSVLQVVQTIKKDTWASSGTGGTTFYDVTGFTANITPTSVNSKILVNICVHVSSGYWEIQGRLTRNGTAITDTYGNLRGSRTQCSFVYNRYEASTTGWGWQAIHYMYLDSPANTSTQTYGLQLNPYNGYYVAVNYNVYSDTNLADYFGTPSSTITLMEIAQ